MEQETKELHINDFLTEEERNKINLYTVDTPFFDVNENGKIFHKMNDEEKMNSNDKRPVEVGEIKLEHFLNNIREGKWNDENIYFYKVEPYYNEYMVRFTILNNNK